MTVYVVIWDGGSIDIYTGAEVIGVFRTLVEAEAAIAADRRKQNEHFMERFASDYTIEPRELGE